MRVVLDTNIVVSGLLWSGTPGRVLQAAQNGLFQAVASEAMIDELREVLERPKFEHRLGRVGKTCQQLLDKYLSYVDVIHVEPLEKSVSVDVDDDMFIACALRGNAQYLVSGDPHLLDIGQYQDVSIITASKFLVFLSNIDLDASGNQYG